MSVYTCHIIWLIHHGRIFTQYRICRWIYNICVFEWVPLRITSSIFTLLPNCACGCVCVWSCVLMNKFMCNREKSRRKGHEKQNTCPQQSCYFSAALAQYMIYYEDIIWENKDEVEFGIWHNRKPYTYFCTKIWNSQRARLQAVIVIFIVDIVIDVVTAAMVYM